MTAFVAVLSLDARRQLVSLFGNLVFERERERGREGEKERGREGGKGREREGGREGGRERGRERSRERESERETIVLLLSCVRPTALTCLCASG